MELNFNMKLTAKIHRYKETSVGNVITIKAGDVKEIKAEDITFCCDEMKEAWNDRFIGFGEFESLLNHNSDVNIYHCLPYPEGAVFDEMAIKHCPFCGAKIEVVVT